MSNPSPIDMDRFEAATGFIAQPGVGTAWPELRALMNRMTDEKVLALPWIPEGVRAQVRAFIAAWPSAVVRVGPIYLANGNRNPRYPAFIASQAQKDAWWDLGEWQRKAYVAYAGDRRDEGLRELRKLEAAAAFWDRMYTVTKAVADAPANIAGGIADATATVTGSLLKRLWPYLIVAGVVALVWLNRGTLLRKVAKG